MIRAVGASLVTVVAVVALLVGGSLGQIVVAAVAGVGVFIYVATIHPRAMLAAFGAVLGAVPYVHVPGTKLPALLLLCAGVWLAYSLLPDTKLRWGGAEIAVAVLGLVAAVSVIATGVTSGALIELTAWLAATSIVIPILRLPDGLRASTARVFAWSAVAGSFIGFAILLGAPLSFRRALRPLGYDVTRNVRQVSGESVTERLTGTYLEPNLAGLILLVAVLAAAVYVSGRWRIVAVGILGLALLLTLSRTALGAAVVAAAVVLVRSPKYRGALLGLGAGATAVALVIPRVRSRLLGTFGPRDIGFSDRLAALRDFPGHVEGHWWWGLGWDRPEFRDPDYAALTNFVANGPLLTIYRGGVFMGIAVTVVAVIVMVRLAVASARSFEAAVMAGGVVGFGLVAFQWDFPIVNQIPAIAVTSLLIALALATANAAARERTP